MNRFLQGLLLGLVAGAGAAVVLVRRAPAPEVRPSATVPAPAPSSVPDEEKRRLSARVAELEAELAAEAKPQAAAPSPPEPAVDLAARFDALVEKGLAAMAEAPALAELVKKKGKEGFDLLAARLLNGKTSQERFLAAAVLGATQDPSAVGPLAEALAKDPDDLVRRMASHALATMKQEAAEPALRTALSADADWGVRVNSAYGLAKLGHADGLRMLENAYTSSETPAEYRLPILGGLADVASPDSALLFRRMLADTRDPTYLFMAVSALAKMKDSGARADLERLAAAADVPPSIREAAQKAVAELGP